MPNQAKQQLLVWWVLWVAFLSGIFMIYHFLGSTAAPSAPASSNSSTWLAGGVPFVISMIIRWGVLPRAWNAQTALALFVAGIAMAEMTCFLGLFLFPAHKQELFLVSVLGIFQFIPTFASRYFD
jgi:hypothetical protein